MSTITKLVAQDSKEHSSIPRPMNIPDADIHLQRLQEKAFGVCLGYWPKGKGNKRRFASPFHRHSRKKMEQKEICFTFSSYKKPFQEAYYLAIKPYVHR